MTGKEALDWMAQRGIHARVHEDTIHTTGSHPMTEEERQFINEHYAVILQVLTERRQWREVLQ